MFPYPYLGGDNLEGLSDLHTHSINNYCQGQDVVYIYLCTLDDTGNSGPSVDHQRFSQSATQARIGPPVDFKPSYLEEAKAHLNAIEREYNKILALCVDTDNLLKDRNCVLIKQLDCLCVFNI